MIFLKCGTDFFFILGVKSFIYLLLLFFVWFSLLTVNGAPVEKTKKETAVTKKSKTILQQLCVSVFFLLCIARRPEFIRSQTAIN